MKVTIEFDATKEEVDLLSRIVIEELERMGKIEVKFSGYLRDSFYSVKRILISINSQLSKHF